MSEFSDEHTIFENLTKGLKDPYVVRFFDDLRESQAKLNSDGAGELTEENRQDFIHNVNQEWIYTDQQLIISGNLTLLSDKNDDSPHSKVNVDDIAADSKGFQIYTPSVVDSESDDDSYRLAMLLVVNDEQGKGVYALADIDNVAVEYPFPSQEKLDQMLDDDLREYREVLDDIVFQDGSLEEILTDLGDFSYEYPTNRGKDRDSVNAIERYLNQTINFDKQLPYYVVLKDEVHVERGEKYIRRSVDHLTDVVGVNEIELFTTGTSNDDETSYMTCFVKMTHYSQINGQPDTQFFVDVRNIATIVPMRDDVDTEFFD